MSGVVFDLKGRRALVTGANRGIGLATARLLAEAGARIAVHFHSDEVLAQEALAGLAGRDHCLLQADLADLEEARTLADRAADQLGGLDILVNNAGIYEPHDITALDPNEWRTAWQRTIDVNLHGPAMTIAAAIPYLEREGGGYIVNITSRGAFRGEPEAPAYGAAKAGLNSLGQSLALKLAPQGIHVLNVAPGYVMTDMTREYLVGAQGEAIRGQSPHGRVAQPEEIAQVVLLAVSGRADAMTGGIVDVNCASYLRP